MSDPVTIAIITLKIIIPAATTVYHAVEKALKLEHKKQQTLKELHKAIGGLKSDTEGYEILLNAMDRNPDRNGCSAYMRFIERQDGRDALESLEKALKATQLLLEEHPRGANHDSTKYPPTSKARRATTLLRDFLKNGIPLGDHPDLISDLKDKVCDCQQDNERAFKIVLNLYVIAQQCTDRPSALRDIDKTQDRFGQALDSFLGAFHAHPFASSPAQATLGDLPTLDVLNQNQEIATRHEKQARRIGKAWVERRAPTNNAKFQELGALQTLLFELLWSGPVEQLKRHGVSSVERPDFDESSIELEKMLQGAILRLKKRQFTIAFCGVVKSGKSLFLNALMGRAILPSDELPSTAWPCRLRHVEGQTDPKLQFEAEPFLAALKELQVLQYGEKMRTYKPPTEDMFSALFSGAPPEPSEKDAMLKTIYSKCFDLHAATRNNLLEFEKPGFQLQRTASGDQNVRNLLGQLNDIVRLCQRFGLKFDMNTIDWPLLTVEFSCLHGHQLDGIYEFIDLPGIEEGSSDHNFESLVRLVSSDSNNIIPVISFKEIPGKSWRRLPELVASGSNRKANTVVCTHLDYITQRNIEEQKAAVSKVFWPNPVKNTHILPCSSLLGLGARDLLNKSASGMTPFETIWDENNIGYDCAKKLLGVAEPKETYVRLCNDHKWKVKLEEQLADSGLPAAIQTLTREMVDRSRTNALLSEGESIMRQLKKMGDAQERKLLEARRTKNEYDAAKRSYDQAREQLQNVLNTWNGDQYIQISENRKTLEDGSSAMSQHAYELINQAIQSTLQKLEPESGPQCASASKVVVKTVKAAEEFLQSSQRELHSALNTLKARYVMAIRTLAEAAKEKRFAALRDAINALDSQLEPQLRNGILGDLKFESTDIRTVAIEELRNIIKKTTTRHTAQSAFRAIEKKIARPWLGPGTPATIHEESDLEDDAEVAVQRSIDELGFMLRAPIAMLATLPFVFGLPVWPWMVHDRTYHLEIQVIYNRYKEEIVDPWVNSLKEEGKKSLVGTIELSSKVAKDLVTSTLEREDNRYKRELAGKDKPMDLEMVQYLVAMYGNLVAAAEALKDLSIRVKDLQERSGE